MAEALSNSFALILAGGSGTRFWPASDENRPKQYLNFLGNQSLIQATVSRLTGLVPISNIGIVSTEEQQALLREQLPQITNLLLEPLARNTAPCIAFAVLQLLTQGVSRDTPMAVFPADHFIGDEATFRRLLNLAFRTAIETKGLVTFGIVPTFPHTGYGYIEAEPEMVSENVHRVRQFVEKPNLATAESYCKSGSFFWNSGIFVWTLATIEKAFREHAPEIWNALEKAAPQTLAETYRSLPSVSIDVAILEKSKQRLLIPASMRWSDVGSWDAIFQLRAPESEANVVLQGDVHFLDSTGCLIKLETLPGASVIGMKDVIVVESNGKLLIVPRSDDQLVRKAAEHFQKKGK